MDGDLTREIDRLAARLGGHQALISHLIRSSGTETRDREAADDHKLEPRPTGWGRVSINIELTREDFLRLDEEAKAFGAPRHRWIIALIRKRLHGGHQFSRSERIQLTNIARELRKIEVQIFKLVRAVSSRKELVQALDDRLDQVSRLNAQVARMSSALADSFRADDDYWRSAPMTSDDTSCGDAINEASHHDEPNS